MGPAGDGYGSEYHLHRTSPTTRSFPGEIRADARILKKAYLGRRKTEDVRSLLAAYVADEALLGNIDEG
jgi:hypothetical protein